MNDYRPSTFYEPFTLSAPYTDRQKIVVVPDEVIEAERKAHKQIDKVDSDGIPIEEIIKILELALPLEVQIVRSVIKAVLDLRKKGIPVWTVGRSEVGDVDFPAGHPRDGVLYLGNPAAHRLYYPAAEFHRSVFEQKFSEAVELVMALGASQLSAYRIDGAETEVAAKADVGAGPVKAFAARFGKSGKQDSLLSFQGTLPAHLNPAYRPTSRGARASGRGRRSLPGGRTRSQKVSLVVRYEEDFGVSAKLKGMVEGAGLDIGGKFEQQQDTLWKIDAEFPPSSQATRRADAETSASTPIDRLGEQLRAYLPASRSGATCGALRLRL